jgi:hypothetical protein
MKRSELRRDIMSALQRSRRAGNEAMFVEAIVDRIMDLDNEHQRQVAVLKATFDAEIDVLRREFGVVKEEFDDFIKIGKTDNVVRLR